MQKMRWVVALVMVGGTWAAPALASETATGFVYEDLNGNGARDAGEPGIAGVAVSNQDEVVLTGEDGAYALPVTDDTVIFVSKPAGYAVPLDKNRLPQSYYMHRPNGSPQLHYGGVAPTGPLAESVDFPLTRTEEADTFSVVAMADPQPETGQEIQYIRDDVFTELVGTDAAFAVVLGDIVSDRMELYWSYKDAARQLGIPVYNVIGNHDTDYDAEGDRDSDDTFHRHFGPNYHSWNYGKVHFVALDTVEWMGVGKGNGNYRGAVGPRQLAWLAKDLAVVPADRLIVLNMHIPLSMPGGYKLADLDALFAVLKDRHRVLALSGHTHQQEYMIYGPDDGWTGEGAFHHFNVGTVSGAWWSGPKDVRGIPVTPCRDGVPNGYAMIHFDGDTFTAAYKAAGFAPDYRMRIYPPGSTGHDKAARSRLLVNVFAGNDKCKVEYSIDEAPFALMTQTEEIDPFALALLDGVLDSGKSWARAVKATHLWAAELEKPMRGGTHAVTIRVTDYQGQTYKQSKIFVP